MNKNAITLQNEKVELHCSSFLVVFFFINLYLCYLDLLTDEIFTFNSCL